MRIRASVDSIRQILTENTTLMNSNKKLILAFSVFALASLSLPAAKLDESKLLLKDFDKLENFSGTNLETTSASEDLKSLFVDSTKTDGKPFVIIGTKAGLLKPGSDYTVRLKYKLSPSDFAKLPHMKLRVFSGTNQLLREYHMGASKPSSFVKLAFKTDEDDPNATVRIEGFGQFSGSISSFSIENGDGEKYYPAVAGAKPYEGDLGKLPTGSEDFEIQLPKPEKELVINAADFGLTEDATNAATIVNKALAKCKEVGASKLIIPKGKYKIFENAHISVSGFKDFTIDGQDSVFIARKNQTCNMHVENCERVKICNLHMDYDWDTEPLAAIVQITNINIDKGSNKTDIDVKFLDYDKYPMHGQNVRVANMENYDISAKAVGQEGGRSMGFGFSPDAKSPDVEWLSPNEMRIKCNWINTVAQKGAYYRLQHYYYGMGGIQTVSNKHLTLENMNIYSCKGHALLVSGSQEYFQFINVKIAPPENSPKRVITCTADHLHFSRSKGHFKMIGCEFAYGSDDCINIHDLSAFGVKVDENVIELKAGSMPEVGDVVELRHGDYSPAKFKSEVVSITVTPDKKRYFYLKDKIPNPRFDGFVIFNRVYDSSHVIIRDCYFHSNRARGLLILASDITIENCKFVHNQMGALKFESGYTFNLWSEGFGVNNVLVKNCTFDTVNPQGVAYQGKVRDVFFGVYMRRDPSFEQTKYPVIRNVMFENNKFKNSFGTIALISSSDNIIFKNNTFENTTPRKKELPYRGAFYINHSTNTKIVNNTYIKSDLVKYPGIFVDEDTSKGIIFEGNTIVEK